jgi:hypothetical protein
MINEHETANTKKGRQNTGLRIKANAPNIRVVIDSTWSSFTSPVNYRASFRSKQSYILRAWEITRKLVISIKVIFEK